MEDMDVCLNDGHLPWCFRVSGTQYDDLRSRISPSRERIKIRKKIEELFIIDSMKIRKKYHKVQDKKDQLLIWIWTPPTDSVIVLVVAEAKSLIV